MIDIGTIISQLVATSIEETRADQSLQVLNYKSIPYCDGTHDKKILCPECQEMLTKFRLQTSCNRAHKNRQSWTGHLITWLDQHLISERDFFDLIEKAVKREYIETINR